MPMPDNWSGTRTSTRTVSPSRRTETSVWARYDSRDTQALPCATIAALPDGRTSRSPAGEKQASRTVSWAGCVSDAARPIEVASAREESELRHHVADHRVVLERVGGEDRK